MSNFEVRYFELNAARSQIKQVASSLTGCSSRLRWQSVRLIGQYGFGVENLRHSISSLGTKLSGHSNSVTQLGNFLGDVDSKARRYEKKAKSLLEGAEPKKQKTPFQLLLERLKDLGDSVGRAVTGIAAGAAWIGKIVGEITGIGAIEKGGSAVATWLEYGASGSTGWGSGSVNAKIGTAEAHATIAGQLFIKDKNGIPRLRPGINAKIGASVSALTLSANGMIGSDMLGLKGKVKAKALGAEASADAKLGLFNKNGGFDPNAKISAKAEAVLGEVEGSAGVTVLGGEARVKGSIKAGVGAHLDVGYSDGVVSVDIGAALGVGGSVGIEVDVGGMINTVTSGAKALWNKYKFW